MVPASGSQDPEAETTAAWFEFGKLFACVSTLRRCSRCFALKAGRRPRGSLGEMAPQSIVATLAFSVADSERECSDGTHTTTQPPPLSLLDWIVPAPDTGRMYHRSASISSTAANGGSFIISPQPEPDAPAHKLQLESRVSTLSDVLIGSLAQRPGADQPIQATVEEHKDVLQEDEEEEKWRPVEDAIAAACAAAAWLHRDREELPNQERPVPETGEDKEGRDRPRVDMLLVDEGSQSDAPAEIKGPSRGEQRCSSRQQPSSRPAARWRATHRSQPTGRDMGAFRRTTVTAGREIRWKKFLRNERVVSVASVYGNEPPEFFLQAIAKFTQRCTAAGSICDRKQPTQACLVNLGLHGTFFFDPCAGLCCNAAKAKGWLTHSTQACQNCFSSAA